MRALYAPIAIFLLVLAFPPACHLALHALWQIFHWFDAMVCRALYLCSVLLHSLRMYQRKDALLGGAACSDMPAPKWRRKVTYVAEHGGYDVDLLAIEDVAQLFAVEPSTRRALGNDFSTRAGAITIIANGNPSWLSIES